MNLINEMFKDDFKVLWDNFLCCECFPKPELLSPRFKWFAVGLDESNHFPPSVHLQPVSVELEFDGKILKHHALINTNLTELERQ